MIPETLRYTKGHEWLRVEENEAIIGITDHAQSELGDIVFVELPEPGRGLAAGEEMGTVESVKAVSEVCAPVAGEVISVNEALVQDPDHASTINQDPYGKGWMVRIRLADPEEASGLLDAEAYRRYLDEAAD